LIYGNNILMHKKIAIALTTLNYLSTAALVMAQNASPANFHAPDGAVSSDIDPSAVPQLVVNMMFIVASFLAVTYLMYGGIKWITSRGDKMGVEAARKHIVAAIIGLVVVAGSFFIMQTVFTVLGANNPIKNGIVLPKLQASPTP
jgi:hypothetical protein